MSKPDITDDWKYPSEFSGGYAYAYDEVRHWLSSVDPGVPLFPDEILAQIEEVRTGA
jgi:hypothetical protein